MSDALIGDTGFLGSSLLRQRTFAACYNSRNIEDLAQRKHDIIICAGAPGKKWLANQNPDADRSSIDRLIAVLRRTHCRKLVLISTIDVLSNTVQVNETSIIDMTVLSHYGRHRRMLENAVNETFHNVTVVRLPGLIGPGLQKNALYDLKHNNELFKIHPDSLYQFYPVVNLWSDLQRVLQLSHRLVHFSSEPVRIGDVARECFGLALNAHSGCRAPVHYDFTSQFASQLGGQQDYLYNRRETFLAIRAYAQSPDAIATVQSFNMPH